MLSRRRLLDTAARTGLRGWLATWLVGLWHPPATAAAAWERTLPACLDALIPADGDNPGALQLGVPQRLAAAAAQDRGYADMLDQFSRWLDAQAKAAGAASFTDLADAERETVLRAAEAAEAGSVPRIAFARLRRDAFTSFYADPRSWPAMGYAGPPQPNGFPDYAEPPRGA